MFVIKTRIRPSLVARALVIAVSSNKATDRWLIRIRPWVTDYERLGASDHDQWMSLPMEDRGDRLLSLCYADERADLREEYYHTSPLFLYPFAWGCGIEVQYYADPRRESVLEKRLDRVTLTQGLRVMADEHWKHFRDVAAGTTSPITADVFLQCVVFGRVVFPN